MTTQRLLVSGDPSRIRSLVDEGMREAGWRRTSSGPASSVLYERGRIGRSVLLGGLARSGQHLTAEIAVSAATDGPGSVLTYHWSEASARALGGILGLRRARREHGRTIAALRARLEAEGLPVRPPGRP